MKVYLRTFGCRANQYDSETVRGMVERSGGEVVDTPEEADVAVFNSCAVTSEAEVELRKGIRRAARRQPHLRTVVMGCASALDRGALRELPTVSHIVPGADFGAVASALELEGPVLPVGRQSGTRALLRIQDGCNEHCTFCATTLARGENRSRAVEGIVEEALTLADRHAEIVLTGIHIGTYGQDIGSSLGALVAALIRAVPSVRFRLSSVEATEVDDQLAELFSEPRRLTPHLHAPLQSGSDRVLRRMGRHWYTAASYAQSVERLVAKHSVFGLGADVIAGFPGESDDDHRATMDLVQRLPFTYLHVFPFSLRPGTAAARLSAHLDPPTVQGRSRELRELGEGKARVYRASRHCGTADVVVVRGETREGLTEDYLEVVLSASVPRGTRVGAVLSVEGTHLVATPTPSVA